MRRSSLLSSSLDVTVRQRLPTTTRERAIVDRLALPMSSRDREGLLAEVLQRGLTSEARLAACAARNLHGAKAVRSLLGLLVGHDSGLELELDGIARSSGVVCEPLTTVVLPDGHRHEVDLLAVAAGLVLEADGWAFHSSPAEREADELRDEALRGIGLEVLRFTARQIRQDPDACRRRVLRAYEGRSWAPPPGVVLVRRRRHVGAA